MDTELKIDKQTSIPIEEVELQGIRAQGAGGQNVNKVSSAVHLRFDIGASSLPPAYKQRLLCVRDQRINSAGIIVIKAQRYRSQEKNRADALLRLAELIRRHTTVQKKRKPTRPSKAARQRRLDAKQRRSKLKTLRSPPV